MVAARRRRALRRSAARADGHAAGPGQRQVLYVGLIDLGERDYSACRSNRRSKSARSLESGLRRSAWVEALRSRDNGRKPGTRSMIRIRVF